jgi:SAM-dependent methyltransferase
MLQMRVLKKLSFELTTIGPQKMTNTLDLGCANRPRNPYNCDVVYGIDIFEDLSKNIKKADLVVDKIPFESNFFEFVTAFDLIEHIPRLIYTPERRLPFIELMNEIYRVLKMDGFFYSVTPAFPSGAAFIDPTHVNFISEGTLSYYFCDTQSNPPWGALYGFNGAFTLVDQDWEGPHLRTLMKKIPVNV